jgi:hypothetical protein
VHAPEEADVLFVPLHTRNVCNAYPRSIWRKCGIDYHKHKDLPGMWRWLLQQPSFAASNGSDHFIITEPPYNHMEEAVRRHPHVRRAGLAPALVH